jgi:hypothetical protein
VTRLVTTSCITVLRSKLAVIPPSAPAMTPWSYPKSSPDRMMTTPTITSHALNRPNSIGVRASAGSTWRAVALMSPFLPTRVPTPAVARLIVIYDAGVRGRCSRWDIEPGRAVTVIAHRG